MWQHKKNMKNKWMTSHQMWICDIWKAIQNHTHVVTATKWTYKGMENNFWLSPGQYIMALVICLFTCPPWYKEFNSSAVGIIELTSSAWGPWVKDGGWAVEEGMTRPLKATHNAHECNEVNRPCSPDSSGPQASYRCCSSGSWGSCWWSCLSSWPWWSSSSSLAPCQDSPAWSSGRGE